MKEKYIIVKTAGEMYGIHISCVENIVRPQNITRMPLVQKYYKGLINLRGEVLAVMSLRLRLALDGTDNCSKARIAVLKFDDQSRLGLLVDEVIGVSEVESEDIDVISKDSEFVKGIGKSGNGLFAVLDIDRIISETSQEAEVIIG